jgi:hypothetical protein
VVDEGELILGRVVEVQDLDLEQVRSKSHEWHQVLLLRNSGNMLNDSIQNIVGQSSGCQSVMLG